MINGSFLKWAGGKRSALPNISKHVPMSGDIWVEPFVGGGTMAINVDYERKIVGDINSDLINLMQWVVKSPRAMLDYCAPYFDGRYNTQEAFVSLRLRYNKSTDKKERAALFLYLNRHCYNGLMRYNASGGFNTTFGKYKNPKLPTEEILFFSRKMKGTRFVCTGFEDFRFKRNENAVVYCDPPYLPKSKTSSFAAY
jgi:DNA adenine methylase